MSSSAKHSLPVWFNCRAFAFACAHGHNGDTPPHLFCPTCPHREPILPGRPEPVVEVSDPSIMIAIRSEIAATLPVSDQRVPRDQWPAWANWLAERAAPEDKGVGDTVERLLGQGGKLFKATWNATFGKLGLDCGCENRQMKWNRQFAYR